MYAIVPPAPILSPLGPQTTVHTSFIRLCSCFYTIIVLVRTSRLVDGRGWCWPDGAQHAFGSRLRRWEPMVARVTKRARIFDGVPRL